MINCSEIYATYGDGIMKKTIAVIFDATTKTYAINMLAALPTDNYFVLPVYITNSGKWLFYDHVIENTDEALWEKFGTNAILSPDKTHGGFLRLVNGTYKTVTCDAVLPLVKATQITAICKLAGMAFVNAKCLRNLSSVKQAKAPDSLNKSDLDACIADKIICGVLG